MNITRSTNIDLIFYTQYLIIKSAASQSQCRMNLHQTAIKQSQVPDPLAVLLSDIHPHRPNCTAASSFLYLSSLTHTSNTPPSMCSLQRNGKSTLCFTKIL